VDNSFVLILWLGIFFFVSPVCVSSCTFCFPFFILKARHLRWDLLVRPKRNILQWKTFACFLLNIVSLFLNEKKDIWFLQWKQNWRCIVSLCLSSPSLIEVRIMPNSLGGRNGRQFCLCMCHQIMFVLFFSLEISNNQIWWSCFFVFLFERK